MTCEIQNMFLVVCFHAFENLCHKQNILFYGSRSMPVIGDRTSKCKTYVSLLIVQISSHV